MLSYSLAPWYFVHWLHSILFIGSNVSYYCFIASYPLTPWFLTHWLHDFPPIGSIICYPLYPWYHTHWLHDTIPIGWIIFHVLALWYSTDCLHDISSLALWSHAPWIHGVAPADSNWLFYPLYFDIIPTGSTAALPSYYCGQNILKIDWNCRTLTNPELCGTVSL